MDGAINFWTKTLGAANAVEMGFTYDPIDRLTGATYKDGAAVLAQYGYTYDKADNRTTERRNEILSTGSFNNVNELTALSGGGVVGFTGTTTEEAAVTVGGQAAQTSLVGTRFEKAVTLPAGTNTVTVAAVDPSGNTNSKNYRVVVSGGAGQSFTYDANGNMTSDGARIYAWDAENRLIKITEGTKTTDIEYDGFHHWTRILEKNGATTVSDRRFIWQKNSLIEQRNGASTTAVQRYFAQGVQQGSSKFFYTRDHLGSIREVVNSSGSVVARYDYDPYGRRTKLSGTFDSDFGFTGHYYHAPSGLHFAPFRAYSAEFGRWISRDPILEQGGINLYAYVGGDTPNQIDLLGLQRGGSAPPPRGGPNRHPNVPPRDRTPGPGYDPHNPRNEQICPPRAPLPPPEAPGDGPDAPWTPPGDEPVNVSNGRWAGQKIRDFFDSLWPDPPDPPVPDPAPTPSPTPPPAPDPVADPASDSCETASTGCPTKE